MQIYFVSTTCASTTAKGATCSATSTPTAGGPFVIPDWAPDIAYIPTTTADGPFAVLYGTTAATGLAMGAPVYADHVRAYTTRTFNLKHGPQVKITKHTPIVLNYQAVGELSRS